MKPSYLDTLNYHWRITALRVLSRAPGYRTNDSVLHTSVESFGHVLSRDQLKTVLHWLQENQLVLLEELEGVTIATLTKRGEDVAAGRIEVPGVKRPGPR